MYVPADMSLPAYPGKPLAVFRADGSPGIGSGHLSRCLALAEKLIPKGFSVIFLCRDIPEMFLPKMAAIGIRLLRLPAHGGDWTTDARHSAERLAQLGSGGALPAWLVIDHYGLDARYESMLRPHAARIMVIDDLENRPHDCDLLLDYNDVAGAERGYEQLVPGHCRRLLGVSYLLLGRAFDAAAQSRRVRGPAARRLFISFGGGDVGEPLVNALIGLAIADRPDLQIRMIIGRPGRAYRRVFELAAKSRRIELTAHTDQVAQWMSEADLAIGAAGVMAWERCALGLPSIIMRTADNQRKVAETLGAAGCVIDLGFHTKVRPVQIAQAIHRICEERGLLERMSERCLKMAVGIGGAERVASIMAAEVRTT